MASELLAHTQITFACMLPAGIQAGDTVLVTAAAGGTGHFAVQLAKLAGCHVIAVCGSQQKADALKQLGADCIVNYDTESVSHVLAERYPAGVDVIYEGVGGSMRQKLVPHLAPTGRLLQVGYISEYPHTGTSEASSHEGVRLDEMFWNGVNTEKGGQKYYGQIWPKDRAAIRKCRQRVFDLFDAGQLTAWVDMSHGFRGVEQVPDAIDYMLQGKHVGKVVIPIVN